MTAAEDVNNWLFFYTIKQAFRLISYAFTQSMRKKSAHSLSRFHEKVKNVS